ncbi:DinB family protein [Chromobacterium phragmitis]|uniref:DinB family protein n=1 Tax=Chromobacterium phragmitis TaxID=2202141 RepID=UPI0018E0A659|nr:DinB family protein [Chromobacterium phragmitis]
MQHGGHAGAERARPLAGGAGSLVYRLHRWYIDYADGLAPAAHDEEVDFLFVDGGKGRMRRGDMLLHIVNHKNYHRGFVADMLYQVPATPPVTDLPVYLRDAHREPENAR